MQKGPLIIVFIQYWNRYHNEDIYAKVDDMTYYPVNNMLVPHPTSTASNHPHLHHRSNAASTASAAGVVGGTSTMSSSHLQHLHHQ